jgi:hypothetical protein
MTTPALAQRILVTAAREIGGSEPLARYLEVELMVLERWLAGQEMPPTVSVLRAVELVVHWTGPFNS